MASSSTTEQSDSLVAMENAATPPTPLMHPDLLMAASDGNHEQLMILLNREDPDAATDVASPDTVVEIDDDVASASSSERALSLLLDSVTPDGGSALHVVAAAGSSERHLRTARVIYDNARHLLGAADRRGSTPLHRAARAGNTAMLSLLIDLVTAGAEEGGDGGGDNRERVEALLRVRNGIGETVLHEAIRAADKRAVEVLMTADPGLAGVPDNGTSPLYLAISLCRHDIARELHQRNHQLSYSGPEGQNALHAAVLRSTEMTELLLRWNRQLVKQQDEHGNTPLHFALAVESEKHGTLPRFAVPVTQGKNITTLLNVTEPPLELTKQLLEADAYSAYQPDKNGSFPIHIAAAAGRLSAVMILLTRYSGCAGLCDSHGRTFLHVAVKNKRYDIVAYACKIPASLSILNKQDNDGNTPLHLAVEVGNWWIFYRLFMNKQVELNLPNNNQHTPRELSISSIPTGLYSLLNSRILIQDALTSVNATCDIRRRDDAMEKEQSPQSKAKSEEKGSKIVSDSTQFLSVGLVLITTMAFGATFALPGGYRADDHPYGGTPTLAKSKQFQGFMMANSLAFYCSSLAVLSLVYAGTPTVELPMRYMHYNIAIWLSLNAVGSLARGGPRNSTRPGLILA
ncbi:unnamed protein product [Urochloa decumbens]|uniref:PGG domain-containing protein n=1 Tax=Urochloa decumbens TaxID=240449 RepID=A0ABC8W0Q1_9POAL